LKQHEVLGIVEFASTNRGKLGPLATRRFLESARRDQGLVRVVEIRPEAMGVRSRGPVRMDAEAFKALGKQFGVQTSLTGEIRISKGKADIMVSALLQTKQVSAHVDAALEVQMIDAATGASIWNSSGTSARSVGNLTLFGGKDIEFNSDDPDKA